VEQKLAIIGEAFTSGSSVANTIERHEISSGQLFFSLIGFALKVLKSVSPSPTRAIEQFQDDRNKALRLFAG
jgi:transposase-like protein